MRREDELSFVEAVGLPDEQTTATLAAFVATHVVPYVTAEKYITLLPKEAIQSEFPPMDFWDSGSHHMGGCRMGHSVEDSVVNSFGQIHEHPRIFVLGSSNFVGSSGAMNPTLPIVALALRSLSAILTLLE